MNECMHACVVQEGARLKNCNLKTNRLHTTCAKGWPEPYICGVYTIFGREITKYTVIYVGLAIIIYIRCIDGRFGREITKYTVIYGVYIRFRPTLHICGARIRVLANSIHAGRQAGSATW